MWNDVDVVALIGEPSSVSSDGSNSCPQDGEAKFPTHVGHRFTIGCSPSCERSETSLLTFVQFCCFLSHCSACREYEGSEGRLLDLYDCVIVQPLLLLLVLLKHFLNGPAVGSVAIMKHSDIIESFVHGVPYASR